MILKINNNEIKFIKKYIKLINLKKYKKNNKKL